MRDVSQVASDLRGLSGHPFFATPVLVFRVLVGSLGVEGGLEALRGLDPARRDRRRAGDEPGFEPAREPGRVSGVGTLGPGGVGKRTLAESWGSELAAVPTVGPAIFAAVVDAAQRHLSVLRTAHASGDHDTSAEAARQLRDLLDAAGGAASAEQRAALTELESDAAPLLAASLTTPSPAAIDGTFYGHGRDLWAADVAAHRASREQAWTAAAAPIAAQLGVDAAIRVDDAAAAHGARGLAKAGVVHLVPTLAPEHADARHILAHELVHVAQSRLPVAGSLADAEREADELAAALVRGSLPHRPRIGLAAGVAAADTGAKGLEPAPADPDANAVPAGHGFVVDPQRLLLTATRSWLSEEEGFTATGRAPQKTLAMLEELQRQGGIAWATHEALVALSRSVATHTTGTVVRYLITGESYKVIGLPPQSAAMVAIAGDGLQVTFRVNGAPEGHGVRLLPEDIARLLTAIEVFTGLVIQPGMRAAARDFALDVDTGAGAAVMAVTADTMANLVGAAEWKQWQTDHGHGHGAQPGAATPVSVSGELIESEQAHLVAWLAAHVPEGAGHAQLSRDLLQTVDAIEHEDSGLRDAILAVLARRGPEEAVDNATVKQAIETARYAFDRARLGLVRPQEMLDRQGTRAPLERQLPARLTQHSDLVLDGDSVDFEVEIDWSALRFTASERAAFADRPWHADVEWVFERPDGALSRITQTTSATSGPITTSQKLSLFPFEVSAIWKAHAFVRSSHFEPTHVTTPVEVKTVTQRMTDLRSQALGDDKLASQLTPDADGHISGPGLFKTRTPAQRAAERKQQMDVYERAAQHLELSHSPLNDEAIIQLRAGNDERRKADEQIHADEAEGWTSFDVRATYLSKTDAAPSGALEIYGAVRFTQQNGADVVSVQLRDLSRRANQADLKFERIGPTFVLALESVVTALAKDYPRGRIAFFTEARDEHGEHPTGQTIGFERDTFSMWKGAKQYLFHPAYQAAVGAATALTMIFAPELAIPMLIVNVVNATVQSVDDLAERANNGTLKPLNVAMDIGQIALAVLPAASSARPIANSRMALFALEAVEMTGQVLLMGAQAKETLESLQAQDVAAIGQMYEELTTLEKSTHASDPRLPALRARIEERAAGVRDRTQQAFSIAAGQGVIFMLPGKVFEAINVGRANAPHSTFEPEALGGGQEPPAGGVGPRPGTVVPHQPAAHEPTAHAPGMHEPAAHEPGAHGPAAHEPAVHQAAAHESEVYEPDAHEPDAHEPEAQLHAPGHEPEERAAGETATEPAMGHVTPEERAFLDTNAHQNDPAPRRPDALAWRALEPDAPAPAHATGAQLTILDAANAVYKQVLDAKFQGADIARVAWAAYLLEHGIEVSGIALDTRHEINAIAREPRAAAASTATISRDPATPLRSANAGTVARETVRAAVAEAVGGLRNVRVERATGGANAPADAIAGLVVIGADGHRTTVVVVEARATGGELAAFTADEQGFTVWVSDALTDDQVPRALGGVLAEVTARGTTSRSGNEARYGELDAMLTHLAQVEREPLTVQRATGDDIAGQASAAARAERPDRLVAEIDLLLHQLGLSEPGETRTQRLAEMQPALRTAVEERLRSADAITFRPSHVVDPAHLVRPGEHAHLEGTSKVIPDAPTDIRPYGREDLTAVMQLRVELEAIAEIDQRLAHRDQPNTQTQGRVPIATGETVRRRQHVARVRTLLEHLQLGGVDKAYIDRRLAELAAVFPGIEGDIVPGVRQRTDNRVRAEAMHRLAIELRALRETRAAEIRSQVRGQPPFTTKRVLVGDGVSALADIITLGLEKALSGVIDPHELLVIGEADLLARLDAYEMWGQRAEVFDPAQGMGEGHPAYSDMQGHGDGTLRGTVEDAGEFVHTGELRDANDIVRDRKGIVALRSTVESVELASKQRAGSPAWEVDATKYPVRALVRDSEGTYFVYAEFCDLAPGIGEPNMPPEGILSKGDRNAMLESGVMFSGEQLLEGREVRGKKVLVLAFGPTGAWAAAGAVNRHATQVDWVGMSGGDAGTGRDNLTQMQKTSGIDRVQDALAPTANVNITYDRVVKIERHGEGATVTFASGTKDDAKIYTVDYEVIVTAMGSSGASEEASPGSEQPSLKTILGDTKMRPHQGSQATVLENEGMESDDGRLRVFGAAATEAVGMEDEEYDLDYQSRKTTTSAKNSADSPNQQGMESVGSEISTANGPRSEP